MMYNKNIKYYEIFQNLPKSIKKFIKISFSSKTTETIKTSVCIQILLFKYNKLRANHITN